MLLGALILFLIPLGSHATLVSSFEAFGRMNAAKTAYFISVPENPNSDKGYTAVFDAQTKQLKFKIDTYLKGGQVLLSNSGEALISLTSRINSTTETCAITIYDKKGESQTLEVFQLDSRMMENIYFVSRLTDMEELNGEFVFYTSDSIYKLGENHRITAEKNLLPKTGKAFERFNRGKMDIGPYLDLSELKTGNTPVIQKLADDLKVKLVNDKKKARRAVFFTLTLNANGTFDFIELDAAVILDLEKGKWVPDERLKEEIREKLKAYTYLRSTVPEGLPYRTFTGKMYLLK